MLVIESPPSEAQECIPLLNVTGLAELKDRLLARNTEADYQTFEDTLLLVLERILGALPDEIVSIAAIEALARGEVNLSSPRHDIFPLLVLLDRERYNLYQVNKTFAQAVLAEMIQRRNMFFTTTVYSLSEWARMDFRSSPDLQDMLQTAITLVGKDISNVAAK